MATWNNKRRPPPPIFSPSENGLVPNPDVTSTEDAILSSHASAFASLHLQKRFDTRPSYGKKGKGIILRANYFTLEPSLDLRLYRYNWSVKTPKEDEKKDSSYQGGMEREDKKRTGQELQGKKLGRVIQLCLESPKLAAFQQDIVTDFRALLIARKEIGDHEITVAYRAECEDEPRQRAAQYTMVLKKDKILHAANLINYLTSKDLNAPDGGQAEAIQAFNILINHHAKSMPAIIATLGTSRSFSLNGAEKQDLEAGLTAMRGFFTSVRPATARMLLNVNVSHAAFYNGGSLSDLMINYLNSNGGNYFKLASFLKKLRIQVNHVDKKAPRVKTIYGLATQDDGIGRGARKGSEHPPRVKAFGSGPLGVQFWKSEDKGGRSLSNSQRKAQRNTSIGGEYISVFDYFSKIYDHEPNKKLPVVNVGTAADPAYLPADVCWVLPGQRAATHLNPSQTKKMITFAVRGPHDNAKSIVSKGLSTAGLANDKFPLRKFGITLSSELIAVEGRIINEPKVLYGKKPAFVADGNWNMVPRGSSLQFAARGMLRGKWSMLFINMPRAYPNAKRFNGEERDKIGMKIETILRDTGIRVDGERLPAKEVELDGDGMHDRRLDEFMERAAQCLGFLFVVLPAPQMPLYNRLKKLADITYGIPTICSVGSKIGEVGNRQDQYLRNEALKVNLKLGGENHHVQSPGLELINENKTMIVGIDVTHPSPGSSSGAPSISAMVANIDTKLSQWPGTLRIQTVKGQEMVTDLGEMLKSRLDLWRRLRKPHQTYPENILVYRDGVSEGQYTHVLEHELPQLRNACKELYPVQEQKKGIPRMSLIIVGKRHHTRFYVTKESDADRSGNPKAGTVVDRGVTEARSWDFFLQSHSAIKGTARPAHYFVLQDEIFRHRYGKTGRNLADELQSTTQSLCYAFGRATKAVSYCTPAYLADILCERGRCYFYNLYEPSSTPSTYSQADNVSEEGVGKGEVGNKEGVVSKEVHIHARLKNSMFYI